jgi:hypothetical protein
VIRSDSGVAHRLSLSARVLSAVDSQVKAKRQRKKRLWRLQNRCAHEFQGMSKSRLLRTKSSNPIALEKRRLLDPSGAQNRAPLHRIRACDTVC